MNLYFRSTRLFLIDIVSPKFINGNLDVSVISHLIITLSSKDDRNHNFTPFFIEYPFLVDFGFDKEVNVHLVAYFHSWGIFPNHSDAMVLKPSY